MRRPGLVGLRIKHVNNLKKGKGQAARARGLSRGTLKL
jgi:hypothetical protein